MSNFEDSATRERSPSHRHLLHLIRRHGPISRAELVGLSDLGSASITNLTRDLIAEGLVAEAGKQRGGKGQPAINLVLNPDAAFSIGVAPNPESVAVAILDFAGRPAGQRNLGNGFASFDDAIAAIKQCVDDICRESRIPRRRCSSVGVALPTTFSGDENALLPSVSIDAWAGTDVVARLSEALALPVRVENDANAATTAERLFGNPSGFRSFVYLYIVNGIGGGAVIDGSLWRGAHGNAAEFGMLFPRGRHRPSLDDLRGYLTGKGEAARAPGQIAELFEARPAIFEPWIRRSAGPVSDMVRTAVACYDPDGIIVGGTMPIGLLERLVKRAGAHASKTIDMSRLIAPRVEVSGLSGDAASAIGAASLGIG